MMEINPPIATLGWKFAAFTTEFAGNCGVTGAVESIGITLSPEVVRT